MAQEPVTYKSSQPVYVDGTYYNAGTPFVTTAEKGETWEEIDGGQKVAMEAADKTLDVQPSLDDMAVTELRALAATMQIQTTADGKQLSKPELVTAIKAVREPTL